MSIAQVVVEEFEWAQEHVDLRGWSALETARVLIDLKQFRQARRWIARAIDASGAWPQ